MSYTGTDLDSDLAVAVVPPPSSSNNGPKSGSVSKILMAIVKVLLVSVVFSFFLLLHVLYL